MAAMTAIDTADLLAALAAKRAQLDAAEAGGTDVSTQRVALDSLARDALLLGENPDATHDQALALTSQVNAVGVGFGSLFDGIGAFLAHPLDAIMGKLDPSTASSDYTPAAATPTAADVSATIGAAGASAWGGLKAWLAAARPWAIGLAILAALALAAYLVSTVSAPLRALRRA